MQTVICVSIVVVSLVALVLIFWPGKRLSEWERDDNARREARRLQLAQLRAEREEREEEEARALRRRDEITRLDLQGS